MISLLEERTEANPEVTLSMDFAIIHHGLGEMDEAFRYLNEAIDRGMGAVVFLGTFPAWRERGGDDPRLEGILERIGHPMLAKA